MTAPASKKSGRRDGPDLTGLELDVRRAGRTRAVERLRAGRTPLQVIALAADAVEAAEAAVRQATRAYPPPASACREGCDWCCHLTVAVTAPELMRVVTHLRQTLSAEEMQVLGERVARLDDERRRLPPSRRGTARLPCALLVDRRCQAYPVRPLTCRGFNSADAGKCEQFLASRQVAVPAYEPQLRLMTFSLDGLSAGLQEARLQGDRLELTAALRIALESPDAFDRWLAGAPAFAAAKLG